MNLRDLHYVIALTEAGSFRRAAERCHVSQPTLSMQVRKLEDFLGAALFERTSKSVTPTPIGRQIVEIARRIAQDEQQIVELARAARDPLAGDFRLGAIPTLASYVFPAFVPALGAAFPKLRLLLTEDKTAALIERLRDGRLDAALLALPVEDAGLEAQMLFTDPFFLAVGPDHPLARRTTVRLRDLDGAHLLLLDDGHCLRDQALAVCRAHGGGEDASFRATSLETLRLMVRGQAGQTAVGQDAPITLMPAIARQDHDGLRYIPFAKPAPARQIGLVRRKGAARAALIADMADRLRSAAQERLGLAPVKP